jgi:hypothetical protein
MSYCNVLQTNNIELGFGIFRNKSSYIIFTIYNIIKINTLSCINFLFFSCSFKKDTRKNKYNEEHININNFYKKNDDAKLDFVSFDDNEEIEIEDTSWGWFIDTDSNY